MVPEKGQIALILRPATVAEIMPLIEKAGPFHCDGWDFDAAQVASGELRFVFELDGKPVCGYVLEVQGRELYIQAAGSESGLDFTKIGLPAIEAQAANLDTVAFTTKRRGLVRKAQKQGYEIDGYILRKKLKK